MFDIYMVKRIGLKMGFYDRVIFIEENKSEYVNFILHSDEKGRREAAKTRFEKDYATIMDGDIDAESIIRYRPKEITSLHRERKQCRNGFRMQCIQQELERLEHELEIMVYSI